MTSKRLSAQAAEATADSESLFTAAAIGAVQPTRDAHDTALWEDMARYAVHFVGAYDEIAHATANAVDDATEVAVQRIKTARRRQTAPTVEQDALIMANRSSELPFSDWLTERYGRWCVASRLTQRLRDKGYDKALSQARFTALRQEFDAEEAEGAKLRAYVLEQLDWLDEAARIDPERFAAALAAMRATINGKPPE